MLTEMKKYITIISVLAAGLVAFTACKKDKEIVGTNDTEGFFINRTELALNKIAGSSLVQRSRVCSAPPATCPSLRASVS